MHLARDQPAIDWYGGTSLNYNIKLTKETNNSSAIAEMADRGVTKAGNVLNPKPHLREVSLPVGGSGPLINTK